MLLSPVVLYAEYPVLNADFTGEGCIDMADYSLLSSSWMTALPWFPNGMLPQKIAHWQLDRDAMDSQSAFDGVTAGNPTWYLKKDDPQNVKIGNGAIGMNGHDHIEIEASRFPRFYGSLTLEAWFKTNYSQRSQTILSKGSTSWKMGINTAGMPYFVCSGLSGTNILTGNTSLADGLWHHLAGVYDCNSQSISIYLDGAVDAWAAASGVIDDNNLDIWIGDDPQTAGEGWNGVIDNVCIYNDALTLLQVFNRSTFHVDVVNGFDTPGGPPDPEWGKGRLKPFKTIQHAIDVAAEGDIIMVWPGIYQESLFFMGKAITIRSAADAAILQPDPADGIAVTFMFGEQEDSILEHFVIINSDIAIYVHQSSPTLRHLTVVNNGYGLDSIFNSHPKIDHCIFWNNAADDICFDTYLPEVTYSCMQRQFTGLGNISSDPLFVNSDSSDPNTMDFHLKSEYGRFLPGIDPVQRPQPENWVIDDQTSPCIDAGSPLIKPFCETMDNGGRVNIGAYGNTPFAAKSNWTLRADLDFNGQVYLEEIILFSEQWLTPKGQQ